MEDSKLLIKKMVMFGIGLALAGCGAGDFNYGKVRNLIEGTPMHLDAEYVVLNSQQFQCGVENDLWDAAAGNGERRFAHLTQKARDLKFSDDVSVGDMNRPYAQIRGDFRLAVAEITNDKEGPEQNTRLVQTKVGVVIPHSCFPDPLPIMGVKKGNFTQDSSPVISFHYDNGWQIDRFVH